MNIIALSLFGAEKNSGSVNDSLIEQIKDLTNLDIQTLKFEIKITNRNGTKGIIARKLNGRSQDIERKEILEDGEDRLIDSERFRQKYKFIYDIPDKPLDRLAELTNDIKFQQNRWITKLNLLDTYLNENIKELLRRKENFDILALKTKELENNKELKTFQTNVSNLQNKIESEDKYYCFKTYLKLKLEYDQIKVESKEVNREKQMYSETIRRKRDEFSNSATELGNLRSEIVKLKKEISESLLNVNCDEIKSYQKWRSSINQTPTNTSTQIDKAFIQELETQIDSELNNYIDNNSINEEEFYLKLVSWIESNLRSNYQIPGTEMTFSNLLENLKERIRVSSNYVEKKKNLELLKGKVQSLSNKISDFLKLDETISKKYSDMTDAQKNVKLSNVNYDQKELVERKKLLKKQMDDLFMRVSNYGQYKAEEFQISLNTLLLRFPDLHELENIRSEDLDHMIKERERDILEIKKVIQKKEFEKTDLEKKIQQAESLTPHEYDNQMNELEKISNSVRILASSLTDWDSRIDKLKNKNLKTSNIKISSEDLNYFNKVSRYLAVRMKTLTHIDRKYDLSQVDLMNSRFIATDGTIIYFSVIGTGQRQLAYILNQLNYDGRTILAIFDEVAMMNLSTMKGIIDKMKELETEGKLLFGIMVSPSDNLEVKSW
jgi:hypothetical protein